MKLIARFVHASLVALIALSTTQAALADTYPSRPIRLLVAYAPGGATDALARQLGQAITEKTGQQVMVDNKPGGASAIAIQALMSAPADGYTMLLSDPSSTTTNPYLFKKLAYKPDQLTPVTRITKHYIALVVKGDSPYRTLKDFADAAKAAPGKLMFGHAGQGTNTQLMGLKFNSVAKVRVPDVAYRGDLPAVQDVMAGNVASGWVVVNSIMPFLKTGQLRVLAVMSDKRLAAVPDVPTFSESGYPDMTTTSWFGIFTQPGVPAAVMEQANAVFRAAATSPKVVEWMATQVMDPMPSSPNDLADLVRSDQAVYSAVIKTNNLALD
jgi:tripartite-type tricarboxylate transporter receptor subunit TctC